MTINKKDIWIVIPVFNEGKYLSRFLEKLVKISRQIVIVDDGSKDKTLQISRNFTNHIIANDKNLGKGAAMRDGAKYAFNKLKAKAIIFMDGDDQHHPEDLRSFYALLKLDKYDLIFSSRRFGNEMPLIRMIGNRLASFFVYLFYGKFIYDIPSGFKAMTKKGFKKTYWLYNDYTVGMEIAVKAILNKTKYTQTDISTIYHDMDRGMQMSSVWKMAARLLKWKLYGIK